MTTVRTWFGYRHLFRQMIRKFSGISFADKNKRPWPKANCQRVTVNDEYNTFLNRSRALLQS